MTTKKATAGRIAQLRIAIYLRISQDRSGEGLGVARQDTDCRKLAESIAAQRGAVAQVEVFTDNDTSAYSGKKRKDYTRLLEAVEARRFDMVIAWHPDRLHRSPIELEHFISLIERTGTEVQTVQAGIWDLTTPSGRMVARQLGAVARFESEHKGARIQAARVQQALAGKFHGGMRPYGFEPDGVTVRPAEAVEIVRMYEQTVAGISLRQIVRDLNQRGIPTATGKGTWTSQSVRDIIMRGRNAGWSVHRGEVVGKAEWPALVSEDVWHAANAIVTDPSRRTSPTGGPSVRWLGSGLYLCEVCGQAELRCSQHSRSKAPTYRCRSRDRDGTEHVNRDATKLDALVEETLVARLERPDAAALFTPRAESGVDLVALRLEQAALRQRLDSLAEMFAAGEIDGRQLATATGTLNAKIAEMDAVLAAAGRRSPLAPLEGVTDIRRAWFGTKPDRSDGLSLGHRREILDMLLTVTVLKAPKGRRSSGAYFSPEFVRLEWKTPTAAA
ncbi:recombinase family protein [Nocardia abscessus]|uniref:recombinase family protein n=1 Tax=Nocardia abscessus TaxID=120957 RepID=UPI002455F14F|nr:recombinase family protein [Nocardia abscessus]